MLIGLLIQAFAFGVLSAIVGRNKNRSGENWFAIGFLFGVFGFIASLIVDPIETDEPNRKSEAATFNPEQHEKKCPDCAERIKLEARVCRYCDHEFTEEEVRQQIKTRRARFRQAGRSSSDNFRGTPPSQTSMEDYYDSKM